MKKILLAAGVIFSLLTLITLILPFFVISTRLDITMNGMDLIDVTPFGVLVFVTPIMLAGLSLSKLGDSIKTISISILFLIGCLAMHHSYSTVCATLGGSGAPAGVLGTGNLYAAILFLSYLFFFIACNTKSTDNKSITEYFEELLHPDEAIDPSKEKFVLCNRPIDVTKYRENGEAVMGKSHICFATSDGYFAALNDDDNETYPTIELTDKNTAVGYVLDCMPTGLFGTFYEDYDHKAKKFIVAPFNTLHEGEAELWLCTENGGYDKHKVWMSLDNTNNIRLSTRKDFAACDIAGTAVIQNGRLAAITTGYDTENNNIRCIAAELMAADLCRKIYEQRVHDRINAEELAVEC